MRCGKNNDTVLHRACEKDDLRIVKLLLEHGADYRAYNLDLQTPLAIASKEVKEACYLMREVSSVLTMHDFQATKPKARRQTSEVIRKPQKKAGSLPPLTKRYGDY